MKRLCAWCPAVLGEKCRKCGAEATLLVPAKAGTSGDTLATAAHYICRPCGAIWAQGEDGEPTHGACADCEHKLRRPGAGREAQA